MKHGKTNEWASGREGVIYKRKHKFTPVYMDHRNLQGYRGFSANIYERRMICAHQISHVYYYAVWHLCVYVLFRQLATGPATRIISFN